VAPDDGPLHLVGESAGGTVVLAAALRHPERVASVTISNAAFVGSGIGQISGWRQLFEQRGVDGWSEHMMTCRFAPGAIEAEAAAWFATQQQQTSPESALAISEMLAWIDLSAEVDALRPPLLILAPEESPFVPPEMCQGLHELTPGSELRTFPAVRHGLAFSHAAQCGRLLLDFLQRRA
jgi:pimeloyl-ACP methyl ester carboxylesterase